MEKNIIALSENELENISGGKHGRKSDSYFKEGFFSYLGVLCASLVFTVTCAALACACDR